MKLYMLSWRTNDEKLLCLKYLGRTFSANSFDLFTTKPVPEGFQNTVALLMGSYSKTYLLESSKIRCYTYVDYFVRLHEEVRDISSRSRIVQVICWRGVFEAVHSIVALTVFIAYRLSLDFGSRCAFNEHFSPRSTLAENFVNLCRGEW